MDQEQPLAAVPDPDPLGLNLVVQKKGEGFNWVLRDGETPKCEGLEICDSLTLAAQDALKCGLHLCESLASQYLEVLHIQEKQMTAHDAANKAQAEVDPEA